MSEVMIPQEVPHDGVASLGPEPMVSVASEPNPFEGQNPLLDPLGRVELRLQRLHTKVLAGKVVEAVGTVVKVALPGVGVGCL